MSGRHNRNNTNNDNKRKKKQKPILPKIKLYSILRPYICGNNKMFETPIQEGTADFSTKYFPVSSCDDQTYLRQELIDAINREEFCVEKNVLRFQTAFPIKQKYSAEIADENKINSRFYDSFNYFIIEIPVNFSLAKIIKKVIYDYFLKNVVEHVIVPSSYKIKIFPSILMEEQYSLFRIFADHHANGKTKLGEGFNNPTLFVNCTNQGIHLSAALQETISFVVMDNEGNLARLPGPFLRLHDEIPY